MSNLLKLLPSDPRHGQILSLGLLLGVLLLTTDFAAAPLDVVSAFLGVLLGQTIGLYGFQIPHKDYRSSLITGLSVSLLLRAGAPWLFFVAGLAAMLSKFFIRFDHKHIFNPANFGIVLMLLILPHEAWVSPAQWGRQTWLLLLFCGLALMVLSKARSGDIALLFLGSYAAMVFGRALWLGDPLAIPMRQMSSGSLLLFAFFMISDPKTIPLRFWGRALFALATAGLAAFMNFELQWRGSLFYALPVISILYAAVRLFIHHKELIYATFSFRAADRRIAAS